MVKVLSPQYVLQAQALPDIVHGFFTRQGGVSTPPYDCLNMSTSVGDRAENVAVNWERVANFMGVPAQNLVTVHQVHGSDVLTLQNLTDLQRPSNADPADAIVSTCRDIAIGVQTADCGPILISDASGDVVAAIHAGWRGAVRGIIENTIRTMQTLGAQELTAVIGPCISQRRYEVEEDMRTEVLAQDDKASPFFINAERVGAYLFDLGGYCALRLRRAGLRHISQIRLDTFSDSRRFFSHRRMTLGGYTHTGRQISAIKAGKKI